MRLRAKETQAARELLKDKKALASALANQAANKVKGSTTSDVKRNIVASNQTSALRAKRNSIAQHSKRNSILHSSNSNKTPVVALRNKRNSIANMLKPVTATQRNSSGGMAAAMQSIRGSVAGNDSDESEDDWDSD
jgi:hypothetical protein